MEPLETHSLMEQGLCHVLVKLCPLGELETWCTVGWLWADHIHGETWPLKVDSWDTDVGFKAERVCFSEVVQCCGLPAVSSTPVPLSFLVGGARCFWCRVGMTGKSLQVVW